MNSFFLAPVCVLVLVLSQATTDAISIETPGVSEELKVGTWTPIKNPHSSWTQHLGEFAVKEYNERVSSNFVFKHVEHGYSRWKDNGHGQRIAIQYSLKLRALDEDDDTEDLYSARVEWTQSDNSLELQDFEGSNDSDGLKF